MGKRNKVAQPTLINQGTPHTLQNRPINIRIHHQATRTWERLEYLEDANYESIKEAHTSTQGEHRWWPRSLTRISPNPPNPIYSKAN